MTSRQPRRTFAAAFATLALALPAAAADGSWQRYDVTAPAVGIDGKTHTASCSGFPGTSPQFSYWARKTSSKNLMVYFEGGGACWNDFTCSYPITGGSQPNQFFVPTIAPQTDPALADGIFRSGDPANPVGDWNVLYIPYCTGDIHTGSADRVYRNLNPAVPLPAFTIRHRGFDNFMVALQWARKNVPAPKNVLVAGVSAGGYGATANSPWVGRAFPNAHLTVLADASQGVTTPNFDRGDPGREAWNPQLAPWVFGSDSAAVRGPELMRLAALGQPHAKLAQLTTPFDSVQIGFYGVQKLLNGPGGSCPNLAIDWYGQMRQQLLSDAADVGNYRYRVSAGTYHTVLRDPAFYTEASPGPTAAAWLDDMLANRGGTHGHGGQWFNTACPGCLVNIPCP